jgi:hypothetical protein
MSKAVTPNLGLDSYSCPHCGALAQQFWQRVFIYSFNRGKKPERLDQSAINRALIKKIEDQMRTTTIATTRYERLRPRATIDRDQ